MAANQEGLLAQQEDTQYGRFLTFILGGEVYGIGIRYVKEIIGLMPITKLPQAPPYIRGIINLRGIIIPIIDVHLKFRKAAVSYGDRTCIIVIDTCDLTAGLIVDNVSEVVSIDDENIVPPPDYGLSPQNRYISGIGKTNDEVKLLLDCEKLLSKEEQQSLTEI
jgi:purine-binding chemotaxis protein CheW